MEWPPRVCERDRHRKGGFGKLGFDLSRLPAEFANPNHQSVNGRERVTSKVMENGPGLNSDLPLAQPPFPVLRLAPAPDRAPATRNQMNSLNVHLQTLMRKQALF